MKKGFLITFEGIDGAGKTTQAKLLYKDLVKLGCPAIFTREPGGSIIGERIREILKDPEMNCNISLKTEALLLQAARAQHVDEKIAPALEDGYIVICDRYIDSSLVYQGIVTELGESNVAMLNNFATNSLIPDLTFIFDIPPDIVMKRINFRQNNMDRWEVKGMDFYKKIREGFIKIAKREKRYFLIDATKSIDSIKNEIKNITKNELGIF